MVSLQREGFHYSAHAAGRLTPVEKQVMDLAVEGWGDPFIAFLLHMQVKTVNNHFHNIYRFLELNSWPRAIRNHRPSAIYWYLHQNPHLLATEEPYFEPNFDVPIFHTNFQVQRRNPVPRLRG